MASDQDAAVPQKNSRPLLSQTKVPVSKDESGNPFITIGGEKFGVDSDGPTIPTALSVTESIDSKGKVVVGLD